MPTNNTDFDFRGFIPNLKAVGDRELFLVEDALLSSHASFTLGSYAKNLIGKPTLQDGDSFQGMEATKTEDVTIKVESLQGEDYLIIIIDRYIVVMSINSPFSHLWSTDEKITKDKIDILVSEFFSMSAQV